MAFSPTPPGHFLGGGGGFALLIVRQLLWGGSDSGWSSLVCILLFITGIQLFCTGIVGQYLSRTYLETKRRPLYIVKEFSEERP
jgi:hypothetical protein